MRFDTLDAWLAWQENLHPRAWDLGLERVGAVYGALGLGVLPWPVVVVGGTNGKGSCVAMMESVLGQAGYRVGAYTSPHLHRYTERIRIAGREIDERALCAAFERIDRVRGETSLTYFEFATLAALESFHDAALDIAILEVGLGGRLDAVNILDADVSLITNVGLDHQHWLGATRDSIAREKAGIVRPGRPLVIGEVEPPATLIAQAHQLGAPIYLADRDYFYRSNYREWAWTNRQGRTLRLPLPGLPGVHQIGNAAAVCMVLQLLDDPLPVGEEAIRRGLAEVSLPGRLQRVPGEIERLIDVAHNPPAARQLARFMVDNPVSGRTHAVVAMLGDKEIEETLRPLIAQVDLWYPAGLTAPRGAKAAGIESALQALGVAVPHSYDNVSTAHRAAMAGAQPGDRVLVCGSFHTVAEVRV